MKDHVYVDETGKRTPVSELSTHEIQEFLRDGIEIAERNPGVNENSVRDRLELELFIREMGLRRGIM